LSPKKKSNHFVNFKFSLICQNKAVIKLIKMDGCYLSSISSTSELCPYSTDVWSNIRALSFWIKYISDMPFLSTNKLSSSSVICKIKTRISPFLFMFLQENGLTKQLIKIYLGIYTPSWWKNILTLRTKELTNLISLLLLNQTLTVKPTLHLDSGVFMWINTIENSTG